MSLRKPNGLGFQFGPDGQKEYETIACGHCTRMKLVYRNDQKDLGGVCYICWRLICGPCADKGVCEPWEEYLAKKEAEFESRRSMGLT
jgi:hypothetical protein